MSSTLLLTFITFLAIGVKLSSGIVLECDFVFKASYWGFNYACHAKNLQTTVQNRNITEVKGNHLEGHTNDDVKKFFVKGGKCPMLPLNVGHFFKNLEIFYVTDSGVKTLTNDDLNGLDKLKVFDVSHNRIELLKKGYFEGKSSIKFISFFGCQLRFVDSSALDPLVNLEQGHFQFNHCVDYKGSHKDLVPILKLHLQNCNGTAIGVDFYPTPPPYEEEETEEEGIDYVEEAEVEVVKHHESIVHDPAPDAVPNAVTDAVHYINDCQVTFMGRNAYIIILLLLFVIIAGIVAFGYVLYRMKQLYPTSMRLSETF